MMQRMSNASLYEINGGVLLAPSARRERWYVHSRDPSSSRPPAKARLGPRSSLAALCPRRLYVFTFVREPLARWVSGYAEWVYRICRDAAAGGSARSCPPSAVRPPHFLALLLNATVRRLPMPADLMHVYPFHRSVQVVRAAGRHGGAGPPPFVGQLERMDAEWPRLVSRVRSELHADGDEAAAEERDGEPLPTPTNAHESSTDATAGSLREQMRRLLLGDARLRAAVCKLLMFDYAALPERYNASRCFTGEALAP